MNRYRDFEAQPDLGIGFLPADRTRRPRWCTERRDLAQDSGPGEVWMSNSRYQRKRTIMTIQLAADIPQQTPTDGLDDDLQFDVGCDLAAIEPEDLNEVRYERRAEVPA